MGTTPEPDTLSFRPCRPKDAAHAVPLIYSSGPDVFRYVFSARRREEAISFLTVAFRNGSGQFGCRNHVTAVERGRVVAVGATWSRADAKRFTRISLRQILGYYRLRAIGVMFRGLRIERVLPPPRAGVAIVAHLGVSESERGRGIGRAMIEHLENVARERGFSRAGLDVAVTNPRARALYERLGYTYRATHTGGLTSRYGRVVDHEYLDKEI